MWCRGLQYARNNDVEGVKAMLRDPGVLKRINDLNEDGMSALHYAARFNNYEIVKLLVEDGKAGALLDYL